MAEGPYPAESSRGRLGRLGVGFAMLVLVAGATGVFSGCSGLDPESLLGPVVTGVSPGSGQAGTRFSLDGVGFGVQAGKVTLTDKNQTAVTAPMISWSDTQIVVTVPAMPSGEQEAPINVVTAAQASPLLSTRFRVTTK